MGASDRLSYRDLVVIAHEVEKSFKAAISHLDFSTNLKYEGLQINNSQMAWEELLSTFFFFFFLYLGSYM